MFKHSRETLKSFKVSYVLQVFVIHGRDHPDTFAMLLSRPHLPFHSRFARTIRIVSRAIGRVTRAFIRWPRTRRWRHRRRGKLSICGRFPSTCEVDLAAAAAANACFYGQLVMVKIGKAPLFLAVQVLLPIAYCRYYPPLSRSGSRGASGCSDLNNAVGPVLFHRELDTELDSIIFFTVPFFTCRRSFPDTYS